jgi:hypothetical protein
MTIKKLYEEVKSKDIEIQNKAFLEFMNITSQKVDWVYDYWDLFVLDLNDKNNRVRAIVSQILCNLAKSDTEKRIKNDLSKIKKITFDEKFVTARHCLLSIYRIALVDNENENMVIEFYVERYKEAELEKNRTLVRSDIIECLGKIYENTKNLKISELIPELIKEEKEEKYQKKMKSIWKKYI